MESFGSSSNPYYLMTNQIYKVVTEPAIIALNLVQIGITFKLAAVWCLQRILFAGQETGHQVFNGLHVAVKSEHHDVIMVGVFNFQQAFVLSSARLVKRNPIGVRDDMVVLRMDD